MAPTFVMSDGSSLQAKSRFPPAPEPKKKNVQKQILVISCVGFLVGSVVGILVALVFGRAPHSQERPMGFLGTLEMSRQALKVLEGGQTQTAIVLEKVEAMSRTIERLEKALFERNKDFSDKWLQDMATAAFERNARAARDLLPPELAGDYSRGVVLEKSDVDVSLFEEEEALKTSDDAVAILQSLKVAVVRGKLVSFDPEDQNLVDRAAVILGRARCRVIEDALRAGLVSGAGLASEPFCALPFDSAFAELWFDLVVLALDGGDEERSLDAFETAQKLGFQHRFLRHSMEEANKRRQQREPPHNKRRPLFSRGKVTQPPRSSSREQKDEENTPIDDLDEPHIDEQNSSEEEEKSPRREEEKQPPEPLDEKSRDHGAFFEQESGDPSAPAPTHEKRPWWKRVPPPLRWVARKKQQQGFFAELKKKTTHHGIVFNDDDDDD